TLLSADDIFFFFQAEDGIRDLTVTGVQTCALPILAFAVRRAEPRSRRGSLALFGALVLGGLFFGVACGAADTASIGNPTCQLQLCFADDCIANPPAGPSLCPKGTCNYQTQAGCPADATCAAQPK